MASGGQRINNASQPSAAFLIKCAKEKEKLRSRLQKQLQKHMLNVLQDETFSDLSIKLLQNGKDSSPIETSGSQYIVHAHSGILRIRVPAFLNEIEKINSKDGDSTFCITSLGSEQLEAFLRKVYTDDDIRKHECDALRLQKKESREIVCEVERECDLKDHSESVDVSSVNRTEDRKDESVTVESPLHSLKKSESLLFERGEDSGDSLEITCIKHIPKQLDVLNVYESDRVNTDEENMNTSPTRKLARKEELLSPALSEMGKADDTPSPLSTSSLVRSSTFDLQCPLALEKVLDAEQETLQSGEREEATNEEENLAWNKNKSSLQQQVSNYKEMMLNTTREIQQCIAGNTHVENPVQSFYLHQRQHGCEHPMHCSTSDGSLADSGFLSQSLFSDTDIVTASLPSSLVNSFDGGHTVNIPEREENSDLQKGEENDQYIEPPSPMFPMYFEIPVKGSIDSNGNIPRDGSYNTTSQVLNQSSTKTMDLIAELPPVGGDNAATNQDAISENQPMKRPQSCYMFIDLDAVAKEEELVAAKKQQQQQQEQSQKRIQSLSMFIDFTKDNKDVVSQAQKQYKQFASNRSVSAIGSRELKKPSYDGIPDLIKNKNCEDDMPSRRTSLDVTNSKDSPKIKTTNSPLRNDIAKNANELEYCIDNNNSVHPVYSEKSVIEDEIEHKTSRVKSAPITKSEKSKSTIIDEQVRSSPRKDKTMKSSGIDEEGLLPMSPIMRRKVVKPEKPKIEPEKVQVKASTKPQDIDAMTFRHSLSESDAVTSTEEVLVLIQDKMNSSLTLVPAVSSSQDNSFTMTVYDSEAKLDQPPEEISSVSPSHSASPEGEANQTEVKTIGWSDSLERPAQRSNLVSSFECEDDTETVYSEVSDVSSTVLQAIGGSGNNTASSMVSPQNQGQSPEDIREQNVGAYGSIRIRALEACSKLGEDLLRMFLEEISWDIIVQVDGREIKAHKCILVSRCKYFATMLKGNWSESAGNKINLQGFSYPVVHFALCHIYSGAINLPKDLAVPELALLADMLVLDTLKDVIVFYLKMNHCHFFHKPCNHCLVGVVECLPVALQCSLKELHSKAVRWIGKHFIRVWPTKAFASLSDELKEQCYQQTLLNMSVETVIDMTLNCDRLMSTVPHVKWAEPVFGLVTRLLEDCIHFMAGKFDQVLASDGFMALGKSQSWNVTALEDSVLSSIELVNPDSACRTFIQLNRLIPMTQGSESGLLHSSNISPIDHGEWTQNFLDLLLRIQRHCERYLIHNANKVVHCQSWALLAPEVQKKIKDAAVIVFEFEKPTAPPPRLTSLQRKQKNPEDKSLTFPRKAQVVRGKKTSKSFRERPSDGKETEVKRPLPADGGVKASSQSSLSLHESLGSRLLLDKETPVPRISRRRASEGYYKIDPLQRSYEEEDEDDPLVLEQSQSIVDDPLQDDLPPPPEPDNISPDEEFPSPPSEEQLAQESSGMSHDPNDGGETDISISMCSEPPPQVKSLLSPNDPPAKPPRRSLMEDYGYDVLKAAKPIHEKPQSKSPKREPPLPPAPNLPVSCIPIPKSPTNSVRSTPPPVSSHIYSKPSVKPSKALSLVPKPCPSQHEAKRQVALCAENDEDDDSSGYEKVWVGVTGTPHQVEEPISPTQSARADLVAEIDEETMLVNSCLHEAEALELAIAKKMQSKQHKLEKMINTSTYSVSSHHHHHHHLHHPSSQASDVSGSSPVQVKKKSCRSSDTKSVVSTSTQIGSKNSLKRNGEPQKIKKASPKSADCAASSTSSGAVTPAKIKVTNESVTAQAGDKSTKNLNPSMLPSRSRPSSAILGPAPGHRDKSKVSKK